jgi:hypothetical protein
MCMTLSGRYFWLRSLFLAWLLLLAIDSHAFAAVSIAVNNQGLSSLVYNGVQYIGQWPGCFVSKVNVRGGNQFGSYVAGRGQVYVNGGGNRASVVRSYPWGAVTCNYSAVGDQLRIEVSVTNRSSATIAETFLRLISLLRSTGPASMIEGSEGGIGGPNVRIIPYGAVRLYVADERIAKPLNMTVGAIGANSAVFLDSTFVIFSPPLINNQLTRIPAEHPIPPGGSDSYSFSLRFAPQTASAPVVLSDLFRRWAERYPMTLNWPDRRPIGQLILASHGLSAPPNPNNPRYWLFVNPKIDINSEQGRQQFRQKLLQWADQSVANLKAVNAQGVIVWDVEGEQFPNLQYVGDPRHLPPEMEGVADEFFRRFTQAGLRCGVTLAVRQLINPGSAGESFQLTAQTTRRYLSNPNDLFAQLDATISYARRRWGCTLFYVDANGQPGFPMNFSGFRRVAEKHRDSLIIPEHGNLLYYTATAPYCDETLGKASCLSDVARWLWPKAFSAVKVYVFPARKPATPMNAAHRAAQGDILIFECWLKANHPDFRHFLEIRQKVQELELGPRM